MKKLVFALASAMALSACPILVQEQANHVPRNTSLQPRRRSHGARSCRGSETTEQHRKSGGRLLSAENTYRDSLCPFRDVPSKGESIYSRRDGPSDRFSPATRRFVSCSADKEGRPNPYDPQLARPGHKRAEPAVLVADMGVRR